MCLNHVFYSKQSKIYKKFLIRHNACVHAKCNLVSNAILIGSSLQCRFYKTLIFCVFLFTYIIFALFWFGLAGAWIMTQTGKHNVCYTYVECVICKRVMYKKFLQDIYSIDCLNLVNSTTNLSFIVEFLLLFSSFL